MYRHDRLRHLELDQTQAPRDRSERLARELVFELGSADAMASYLAQAVAARTLEGAELEAVLRWIGAYAGDEVLARVTGFDRLSASAELAAEIVADCRGEGSAQTLRAARPIATRLAPALGLSEGDYTVQASPARTASRGFEGAAEGAVVYLDPARFDAKDAHSVEVLAHELVHVAQHRRHGIAEGPSAVRAAEAEAYTLGARVAAGASARPRLAAPAIAAYEPSRGDRRAVRRPPAVSVEVTPSGALRVTPAEGASFHEGVDRRVQAYAALVRALSQGVGRDTQRYQALTSQDPASLAAVTDLNGAAGAGDAVPGFEVPADAAQRLLNWLQGPGGARVTLPPAERQRIAAGSQQASFARGSRQRHPEGAREAEQAAAGERVDEGGRRVHALPMANDARNYGSITEGGNSRTASAPTESQQWQDEGGQQVVHVAIGERVVRVLPPNADPTLWSRGFENCGATVIRGRMGDRVVLLMGHVIANDPVGHYQRLLTDLRWLRSHGVTDMEVMVRLHPDARGSEARRADVSSGNPGAYRFPSDEEAQAAIEAAGGSVRGVTIQAISSDSDDEVQVVASRGGASVYDGGPHDADEPARQRYAQGWDTAHEDRAAAPTSESRVFWVRTDQLGELMHVAAAVASTRTAGEDQQHRYVLMHPAGASEESLQRARRLLGEDALATDHGAGGVLVFHDEAELQHLRRPYQMLVHATEVAGEQLRGQSADSSVRRAVSDQLTGSAGASPEQRAARDTAVRAVLGRRASELTDPDRPKILIWNRSRTDHGTDRNTSPEALAQLCEAARRNGLTPVIVGARPAEMPEGAVDMTGHWSEPEFGSEDGYQRQMRMFQMLHQEYGVVGQTGLMSGVMDGVALSGVPTVYLASDEAAGRRMHQFEGVDGHRRVDSGDYSSDSGLSDDTMGSMHRELVRMAPAAAAHALRQRIQARLREIEAGDPAHPGRPERSLALEEAALHQQLGRLEPDGDRPPSPDVIHSVQDVVDIHRRSAAEESTGTDEGGEGGAPRRARPPETDSDSDSDSDGDTGGGDDDADAEPAPRRRRPRLRRPPEQDDSDSDSDSDDEDGDDDGQTRRRPPEQDDTDSDSDSDDDGDDDGRTRRRPPEQDDADGDGGSGTGGGSGEGDDDAPRVPRTSMGDLIQGDDTNGDAPVDASPNSVTVRRPARGGGSSETTVTAGRRGGEVEHQDASGRRRSLGVELDRGPDGELRGMDLTLGAGGERVSGTITGGWTYYANIPRRQRDGTWRVSWKVELRAGGGRTARRGPGSAGVSGRGAMTREGVDVFATQAEALRFQRGFRGSASTIIDQLTRTVRAGQGTVAWWRSDDQAVGTERTVTVALTVTPTASVTIQRMLQLGISVPITAKAQGKVAKTGDDQVDVTQTFEVRVAADLMASAGGIGVSGAFGSFPNGYQYKLDMTYRVDLSSSGGRRSFASFLRRSALLEEHQAGVTLRTHTYELGPLMHDSVDVLVADMEGERGMVTRHDVTRGADGSERDRVTGYRAFVNSTGNAVNGDYFRRNLTFDTTADAEGSYQLTIDYHSTEDEDSSGNWQIVETFSQEEMRLFHERFVARGRARRRADDDEGAIYRIGPYNDAFEALSHLPTHQDGLSEGQLRGLLQARARIIARLVSRDGERAIRVIRGYLGGSHATVRLFGREGEDTTFLTDTEQRQIEQRIAGYHAAVRRHERAGEAIPASVVTAITDEMTALRRRRDRLRDPARYRDLPVSREQLLAPFERFLSQLEQLRQRAEGVSVAMLEGSDAATYDAYYEMSAAQSTMNRKRAWAERERDALQVAPDVPASTGGLEQGAQGYYDDGHTAEQSGQIYLDGARADTAGDVTRQRDFRRAQERFEEATRNYEQAARAWHQAAALRHAMADPSRPPRASEEDREGASTGTAAASADNEWRRLARQMGVPRVDLERVVQDRYRRLWRTFPHTRELIERPPAPTGTSFDRDTLEKIRDAVAVARFQSRTSGLGTDGVLGRETLRRILEAHRDDPQARRDLQRLDRMDRARRARRAERRAERERAADAQAEEDQRAEWSREVFNWDALRRHVDTSGGGARADGDTVYLGRGLFVKVLSARRLHSVMTASSGGERTGVVRGVTVTLRVEAQGVDSHLTITNYTIEPGTGMRLPRGSYRVPLDVGRRFDHSFPDM